MTTPKPFVVPQLKDQLGIRLSDKAKRDLRIISAERREAVLTRIIEDLLAEEAERVRKVWEQRLQARAAKEDQD